MNILLHELSQKHFKGITKFSMKVNGKNANVYGENGTGKTTQFDAFLWLLFGKDSQDRSTFKIKPQDADGLDVHYLQTEVEAMLLIDGKPIKLRKMLEEKWTQKRGAAEKELTGNIISYWWDEEPVKEGEYKKKIGELIDENVFRMITNPMYFNTKVKWEDRRRLLLEMCGDKTDEEVIAADPKLARLGGILGDRTIDSYKKILAEKLRALEKERTDIPPRIDELMLTLPQVAIDYMAVEQELHEHRSALTGIDLELTTATNAANAYRQKQQTFFSLKSKLENIKARIDSEAGIGRKKLVDEKSQLLQEKYQVEATKNDNARQIVLVERSLENNAVKRQQLIAEWKSLNEALKKTLDLSFEEPNGSSFICPTCSQELPMDAKESKLDELRTRFENNKQSEIFNLEKSVEQNKSAGLALKKDTEAALQSIEKYKEIVFAKENRLQEISKLVEMIDEELSQPTGTPNYEEDTEYLAVQKEIEKAQYEIEAPAGNDAQQLLQNKNEVLDKINACNAILHNKTSAENTRKRVEELRAEEKRLAAQITELEGHKYLMEQFVVAKVNLLEANINSHFKHVTFKMFNQQVNGGIDECCDAMINGVPFADTNHAGKVNAGIDCINALCNYYEVTAPIFIDFRESVSRIIDTESQIINLIKNEADKALRVEVLE